MPPRSGRESFNSHTACPTRQCLCLPARSGVLHHLHPLHRTTIRDVDMTDIANATTETEPHEEITPEMVEAGYRVLLASGITDDPLEADRLLVEEIYRAMFLLRPPTNYERWLNDHPASRET